MGLANYRQKRNFKKTSEPIGRIIRPKTQQLLFVIQKHAASHLHYDFRLELKGVLLSWAVPKGPCLDPSVKRLAIHVEDHPLEYAQFEGIIPAGQYGGGTVMIWDEGTWAPEDKNPVKAYHDGLMTFTLNGEKLKGRWKLIRLKSNDKDWLLIKVKDEFVKPLKKYDITQKEPDSVVSGQSIDSIGQKPKKIGRSKEAKKSSKSQIIKNLKKGRFPDKPVYPELATLVDRPPAGAEWFHEIKFDGYRILAFKHGKKVQLWTRNGLDWTSKFPEIADKLSKLSIKNAVLDGEIVVLDEQQHANFQLLQNSLKQGNKGDFIYYLFDLIYYDQYDLTQQPLKERKRLLQSILPEENYFLRYSEHVMGSGESLFKKACDLGLEGLVSKYSKSVYQERRTKNWLKVKCDKRQEFIIVGFTPSQGKRSYFRSLLLGTYNHNKKLVYSGRVGTGFTEDTLKMLYDLMIEHQSKKMPFDKAPPESKTVIWLKPVLIAEVQFTQWTNDGRLRHPSFKGLRKDKPAKHVIREIEQSTDTIDVSEDSSAYKLTHPDKILYLEDKITKHDLAAYYQQVANWILPYIVNRPLTWVRCPNGYHNCFFQKHLEKTSDPSLYTIKIKEKTSVENSIYIKDEEGLLALPQLGVLELHPWGSHIEAIEHPDIMIFDLDPAPDVPWREVVAAAFEMKKNFSTLKLKSFVKTTGGKGLHVVVPIRPEYNWNEIKSFSHFFVDAMVLQNPDQYLSKMTKADRKGKIFLDYLRNQRGATAIAPYSTRARKHAPIATPLDWSELTDKIEDTFYTLRTLPKRLKELKKDPWKDFFKINQSLNLEF